MFKSLLLKIIGRVASTLFFRKSKVSTKVNANEIKTILVNRSDRLGDAIISLPFLMELNKRFNVTVLTSNYNDVVLRDFLKTQIVVDKPLTLTEVIKVILRNLISFNYPFKKNNVTARYDLYIDLVGIRGLAVFLKVKKENLCRHYIGFNMFIWSLLLDYAYRGSAELSKKHIMDVYSQMFYEGLGLDIDIPDYIDLSSKMVRPEDLNLPSRYIFINISGYKKFRGPSAKMYAQLVNALNFSDDFVVMDELNQPNLEEFKRYAAKDNICYLEKNYSIWELLYISRNSLLYIGSDSGITHILQVPTNSVLFFATGTSTFWRPFSKNLYHRKRIGSIAIEETKNSQGLIKKIIYHPIWCRPCYDIGCRSIDCLKALEQQIEDIAYEIKV